MISTDLTDEEKEICRQRVKNGVTFLDKHISAWRCNINTKVLNIADYKKCVCGQLDCYDLVVDFECAISNGFYRQFNYALSQYEYAYLTKLWKEEVERVAV